MRTDVNVLINIDVEDLERAERFYFAAFGLVPGRRFGAFGVELLGCPAPIYLLAKREGSSAAPGAAPISRTYERHWTPVHLDFVVDDVEAASRRAIDAGAKLESPISLHEWGKLALMADPFGHGFCFVELIGAGYDAIATNGTRDVGGAREET